MKKNYRITIRRDTKEYADCVVRANSPEEAEELVTARLEEDGNYFTWDYVEPPDEHVECSGEVSENVYVDIEQ